MIIIERYFIKIVVKIKILTLKTQKKATKIKRHKIMHRSKIHYLKQ